MTLKLGWHVAAPPEMVLEAIQSEATYWQESLIPSDLRSAGALGVNARISNDRFNLTIASHREPPPTEYALFGTVVRHSTGGSSLAAVAHGRDNHWLGPFVLAGLLFWFIVSRQVLSTLLLCGIAVLGHALRGRRVASLTRTSDAGLAHLVDRLEIAIRAAEQRSSQSAV
jgi:hypothetical protein